MPPDANVSTFLPAAQKLLSNSRDPVGRLMLILGSPHGHFDLRPLVHQGGEDSELLTTILTTMGDTGTAH